jgi:hypothetical protein
VPKNITDLLNPYLLPLPLEKELLLPLEEELRDVDEEGRERPILDSTFVAKDSF